MRLALACTLLAPLVSGHAILLDVSSGGSVAYPRTGISGTQGTGAGISGSGTKLQPFADAKIYADETKCGGAVKNKDPGVETPLVAFSPNDELTVKWRMTIPHPIDYPLDEPDNTASPGSGVRIAMHYGATDSFEDNILAGGVAGDLGVGTLAAGTSEDDPGRNGEVTATITLDAAKTCDYCTLQWIWAANADGGSYIGCADISITTDGQLPVFASLPSQNGNVLPGVLGLDLVPNTAAPVGNAPNQQRANAAAAKPDCGMGTGGGVVLGLFLGGLGAAAGVYFMRKRNVGKPAGGAIGAQMVAVSVPAASAAPPPQPMAQPPGAGGLPAGWTEVADPASGRNYFHNAATGATSWTRP